LQGFKLLIKDVHKAAKDISKLYKKEKILYIPILTYTIWFIILVFAGLIGKILLMLSNKKS